jgi:3',5'-cyclic-AMP phosphodiesterase
MTTRRAFLVQLAAGSGTAQMLASSRYAGRPAPPAARQVFKVRFAVASDGHYGQPGTDFERFHGEIVDWLNDEALAKGLDFVIFNGDVIHDEPALLPHLKERYARLQIPYFVNRGNHDRVAPAVWTDTWGYSENHSFERGDYAFVLASTSNQEGEYRSPDVVWLRSQIHAFKEKKGIFAFLHIAQVKFTRHAIARPEAAALLEQTANLLAVFHGHDHDIDNVIYSNGRAHFFDGHMGGSWGTNYRGYRIVEVLENGTVRTCQRNPQAFQVNSTRLGG